MKKGLDRAFLEYGIRQPDLQVIAELCEKHELDTEWLKESDKIAAKGLGTIAA